MQDKTINNALRQLYLSAEYRELAGALLELRGVAPPRLVSGLRYPAFARNEQRRLILDALRDGPKLGGEIVEYVAAHRPDMPRHVLQNRLAAKMWKLKQRGYVRRDGRVWGLT